MRFLIKLIIITLLSCLIVLPFEIKSINKTHTIFLNEIDKEFKNLKIIFEKEKNKKISIEGNKLKDLISKKIKNDYDTKKILYKIIFAIVKINDYKKFTADYIGLKLEKPEKLKKENFLINYV